MIDNEFELTKILGKGGSSKVFLANNSQGDQVAIKAIRKDKRYSASAAASILQREHDILQKLRGHPNIIQTYGINLDGMVILEEESENIMYNVLEYAQNGALSNLIRHTGGIEEEITRFYITQLWNALDYIHSHGYAHLDIKLENILWDEFFNLKVADMGSWTPVFAANGHTDKRRGTLLYMAPEVIDLHENETFDAKAADVYSLGITIFVMLTGEFPTAQEIRNNLSTCESDQKISDGEMETVDEMKVHLGLFSKEVKYLIQQMLNPDPSQRPTISQVLSYSWLTTDFESNFQSVAYSEMNSRKEHIQSSTKSSQLKYI
jgi:serine/threonine protein kinase